MKYLSVCSGIEAASVAWEPLGFEPVGFSEIDPFPCAVLKYQYPAVKNYGDMTKYKEWDLHGIRPDILIGGTPCQSFSVAGLRKGLADPRGNLMLTFGAIANNFKPSWIVWENVPGVLSSNGGRDFGTFLGMLAEIGYGFAYTVLDAQYFGVPQRRKRVFVVGCLGDWRSAAEVLFECESLSGHTPESRGKEKSASGEIAACLRSGGAGGIPSSRGEHPVVSTFDMQSITQYGESPLASTVKARDYKMATDLVVKNADAFALQGNCIDRKPENGGNGCGWNTEVHYTQTKLDRHAVSVGKTVRRLTPVECERLQGFPDDWTLIPWNGKSAEQCVDGPRYRACGNSMAVPVIRWIGERIKMVEEGRIT